MSAIGMSLQENPMYRDDLNWISRLNIGWDQLKGRTILISGGTGMIGSCLVDAILHYDKMYDLNCRIIIICRNISEAEKRFRNSSKQLEFLAHDINFPLEESVARTVDYVLHLASNTHPVAYAADPIGTITANIIGLKNLLDFSVSHKTRRFLFASSNEIYGENRGDVDLFQENYCGYINCNTMRAGYPESKRCGEALCQAYIHQKELDIAIARFTRTYGPTMRTSDTKAVAQFIKKGVARENIVLKSKGTQEYSYTYVCDAVAGLLTILLKGNLGEAYNISDAASDITLRDLAELIAADAGTNVVYEIPDLVEQQGYSVVTKARLDGGKLQKLGWNPRYAIQEGIPRTLEILRDIWKGPQYENDMG